MATKVLDKAIEKMIMRAGDLDSLRNQINGPVKVYLPSDERNDNGELLTETFMNGQGEEDVRPLQSAEPFLSKVFYKRNFRTPKMQEQLEQAQETYKDSPLKMAIATLVLMVADWDLTCNGKKVIITFDSVFDADLPDVLIYGVLTACYEHNRPPKELSDRLQSTSLQEE